MKKELISVVVTSYNYQDYIKETLNSILVQTYDNFEVIVFDDGSKDDSVKIIKEFEKKDKRIKLYQHEGGVNKGIAETVKAAVMETKGKWIAFCESDDYWAADNLEQKMKYAGEYPDTAIIANNVEMFGDKENIEQRKHVRAAIDKMSKFTTPKNAFTDLYYGNIISTFSAVMIEAGILKTCSFNTPNKPALDWWLYRQISFNHDIGYLPEILSFWRIHPGSIISTRKDKAKSKIFIKENNKVIKQNNSNYNSRMLCFFPKIASKYILSKLIRYKIRNGVLRVTVLGIRILKIDVKKQ